MNLKKQIILLIAGIFIIPIISVFIVISTIRSADNADGLFFDFRRDSIEIHKWLQAGASGELPTLSNKNIIILLDDNIYFNNIPDVSSNDIKQITRDFDVLSSWYHVGNDEYQVIHRFKKSVFQTAINKNYWGLSVPALLLLFIATMTSWILQTIHRKIKNLVNATQKIANGDFSKSKFIEGNDEFSALSESLDNMRLQIKEDQDNRTRLLMGISHDLKTPLASIKGYVQAIQDGLAKTDEKREKYISIIASKSDLLEQRISALIEFVKLETSQWNLERKNKPLKETVTQWFSEFSNDIEVSGRYCSQIIKLPNAIATQFDSALVRRALENLVSNAIKYSNIESTIECQVQQKNSSIEFEVKNEGEPFTEGDKDQLFSAFFRVDSGRNQEGMGLGLTVVEKVAALHGGAATYDYHQGRHCFRIQIPLLYDK